MNIEDFKPFQDDYETIFEKQREIKFRYEPEAKKIFQEFDIDTYEDQEVFKKYCWRITEELMEALEDEKDANHFKEELIDGFNFLVELYLLYGWSFGDMEFVYDHIKPVHTKAQILRTVYQLGITANLLKNRQWRRSQYLVDLYKFEPRFRLIWDEYLKIFYSIGMSDTDVKKIWSLKYQVNLFRLNTNY